MEFEFPTDFCWFEKKEKKISRNFFKDWAFALVKCFLTITFLFFFAFDSHLINLATFECVKILGRIL